MTKESLISDRPMDEQLAELDELCYEHDVIMCKGLTEPHVFADYEHFGLKMEISGPASSVLPILRLAKSMRAV